MNRKIWASLACASLIVAFSTGCKEETALIGDNTGYITLALDFNPSPLQGSRADRSRTDESTGETTDEPTIPITESDLSLTLSRDDGTLPPEELTIDELGEPKTVHTGDYTLEASYGSDTDEGWDSPYFYGSQQLTVENNAETHVSLPVRLANSIINIVFSDGFLSFLTDYKVTVTSSAGNDFEWEEDNSSSLYVTPGEVLLTVDFTKPNGSTATIQVDPFEAEAQHNYTVTLDVDYQDEKLSITTDDTLEDPKDVEIDISDANLPKLAPKPIILPVDGFTFGTEIDVVAGNQVTEKPVATIVARGGITSAALEFKSVYLSSLGLTSPIELTEENAKLSELGISTRGLISNRDVFATVDFSGMIPNIPYLEGEDNASTFSLTVTDSHGVESNPTDIFTLNVEKITLEILDGSSITGDGIAELIVRYNGPSPATDIEIEGHNRAGGYDPLPITHCEPGNRKGSYNLTIESSLITLDHPLIIHAKTIYEGYENKEDFSHYTLEVPPIRIMEEETNVYAKYAYATVLFTTKDAIVHKDKVRFEVSSDAKHKTFTGVTSEVVSDNFATDPLQYTAVYKITGLTPSTNYVFHAIVDNETDGGTPIEITEASPLNTEGATQLQNNKMEDWYKTEVYTHTTKYVVGTTGMTDIVCWHPNKTVGQTCWATRNALTTGQTSGTTCYYTSFSGTVPVTGDTGKAAEISTLGYGEGTTYTHTSSGKTGDPKMKAVGMLFNGTYENGTEIFGVPFTSRPISLSFKYKFTPVNNESFAAYIVVEHRNGNEVTELGRGELVSGNAKRAFTDYTIPINYTNNKLKATHIYTVFKSSTEKDDAATVLSVQGGKNALNGYSDSKYVGSVLTVDDIILNY